MSKNQRRRTRSRTRIRPDPIGPPHEGHPTGAAAGDSVRASAEQATMLTGLITSGGLDPYLALLTRVIGQRQRHLIEAASVRALAAIDLGHRVRVNRHIRPLYLQGSTGTVTGWSGRSAIVTLDVPNGRFAEVRCPPLGLDRIDSR